MKKRLTLKITSILALVIVWVVFVNGTWSFAESPLEIVQWQPLEKRLLGEKYILPTGWRQLVKGVKSITVLNYGSLTYDPATVKNAEIFEQLTGVKIKFIALNPEQVYSKVTVVCSSKASDIDVFPANNMSFMDYVKAGWIEPLDPLYTEEYWKKHYTPAAQSLWRVKGHWYAAPQIGRVTMLHYRPSLLKEAGYNSPPSTWSELREYAKKLTKDLNGDGTIDQWGYVYYAGTSFAANFYLNMLLYQAGGRVLRGEKYVINSPEAIKALQYMVNLKNVDRSVPPGVMSYEDSDCAQMFIGGKVALMTNWTYVTQMALDPSKSTIIDDYSQTYNLKADGPQGRSACLSDVAGWCISKFSKKKGAAALWCDFYRSRQALENEVMMENNTVAVPDVYESPKVRALIPHFDVFIHSVKNAVLESTYMEPTIYKIVFSFVQKALMGEMDPAAALNSAQKEINRVVYFE